METLRFRLRVPTGDETLILVPHLGGTACPGAHPCLAASSPPSPCSSASVSPRTHCRPRQPPDARPTASAPATAAPRRPGRGNGDGSRASVVDQSRALRSTTSTVAGVPGDKTTGEPGRLGADLRAATRESGPQHGYFYLDGRVQGHVHADASPSLGDTQGHATARSRSRGPVSASSLGKITINEGARRPRPLTREPQGHADGVELDSTVKAGKSDGSGRPSPARRPCARSPATSTVRDRQARRSLGDALGQGRERRSPSTLEARRSESHGATRSPCPAVRTTPQEVEQKQVTLTARGSPGTA